MNRRNKNRKTGMGYRVCVILVLCVIAGGLCFFLLKGNAKKSDKGQAVEEVAATPVETIAPTLQEEATPTPVPTAEGRPALVIGDSRTVGMAYINGVPEENFTENLNTVHGTKGATLYLGACGVGYDYWFAQEAHTKEMEEAIASLNDSSKVVFWLGVNDIGNYKKYCKAYNALAAKYPKLVFSCAAVVYTGTKYPDYEKVNQDIDTFNQYMQENLINIAFTPMNEIDSMVVEDDSWATDGLHFWGNSGKLYKKIFRLM